MKRQGFPKGARLRARAEFESVQSGGRRLSRPSLLALWRTAGSAPPRLGIAASARTGNAVVRNTAKRWIREWFRRAQSNLPAGLELVLVVRRGAVESGHPAVDRDLGAVERRLAEGRLDSR